MGRYIKVNTSMLDKEAQEVAQAIREMRIQRDEVRIALDQFNGMWEGSAKDAFVRVVDDDLKALDTVIKNLENIHNYETEAKEKYDRCIAKAAGIIQGISI